MFVKIRSEYFQKKSRKKCEDITKIRTIIK